MTRALLRHKSSPHEVATGFSAGVFAAFIPVFGFQMILAILLAMPFKNSNKLAAALATWITNPVTGMPFLFLQFWVGDFICKSNISFHQFKEFSENISLASIKELSSDLIVPFAVGTLVLSSVSSILSYFIVKYFVQWWRSRKKALEELRGRSEPPTPF